MSRKSRRIPAVVGLAILDTLRAQDRPDELLRQEDPAVTLPRRLGLSSVVTSQIGRYEAAARSRESVPEDEVASLVTLVLRREDADLLLERVGRRLADGALGTLGWRRLLPGRWRRSAAQRRVGRALRELFPGLAGRPDRGGMSVGGIDHFFVRADPAGGACDMVLGFMAAGMEHLLGSEWSAFHPECVGRGDPECRWGAEAVQQVDSATEQDQPGAAIHS